MVSTVTAPIEITAGLREKILMIEEPMAGFAAFCETMLSIEKFSMPHVSGTHIASIDVFDKIFVHSNTCSIDNNEPKLQAIFMEFLLYLSILVFLSQGFFGHEYLENYPSLTLLALCKISLRLNIMMISSNHYA
jgi:hypothetical protein